MKYFVVASVYDDEKKMAIRKIIGYFDTFIDARLFRDAYNIHYHSNAEIASNYELVNE